jgi:gamma-glutamyltranspeptidase/glutathione hydrolase
VKVAQRMDLEFGSAQLAHVMEHGYLAASDHRKDGYPMGY